MLLVDHRPRQIPGPNRPADYPALRIRNSARRLALPLRQESQDGGLRLLQRRAGRGQAGRRPESDEHLALAVKAMMAAQRQEGSWEGDPVYQGFNTPFRATQFAVMALSTLYPGTDRSQELGRRLPRSAHQAGQEQPATAALTVRPVLGPGPGASPQANSRSPGEKRSATGT